MILGFLGCLFGLLLPFVVFFQIKYDDDDDDNDELNRSNHVISNQDS